MTHEEARDRARSFAYDAECWEWGREKISLRHAKKLLQRSASSPFGPVVTLRFGRVHKEDCPTDKIQSSCLIYWEGQRGPEIILGELVRDSRGHWKYYHNA